MVDWLREIADWVQQEAALSRERQSSPNLRPYSDKPQYLDITESAWRCLSDREARELIDRA